MRRRKRESRREHNPVIAISKETAELAANLAPLEEHAGKQVGNQTGNNGDAIDADTGELNLPKDFTEREDEQRGLFKLEPLALIIMIFSIAFITFIVYLISIEPPKAKDEQKPGTESRP